MNELRGRVISYLYSPEGEKADIVFIEPNGDEVPARCLCKPVGTEITGDGEMLWYLNKKYSEQIVCNTARAVVLGK